MEFLIEVVRKIDVWRITEVEIPTSPDFEAEDLDKIDFNNVIGGNTMFPDLILGIFEGDDYHLREIHTLSMEKINKIKG